jgi:hypothetical protein
MVAGEFRWSLGHRLPVSPIGAHWNSVCFSGSQEYPWSFTHFGLSQCTAFKPSNGHMVAQSGGESAPNLKVPL